jgi:hypothetical protein
MLHSADGAFIPDGFQLSPDVLIPVVHPPDALIIAREAEARREKQLDAAAARVSPGVNWVLLGLALATF